MTRLTALHTKITRHLTVPDNKWAEARTEVRMGEYKELLAKISEASETLNAAAEEASDVISSVEKRLLDAEPGITVWHDVLLDEEATFEEEETGTEHEGLRVVTLGFAKVKGKWGIALRDEVLGKKRARDNDYTELLARQVTLLRKADRDLRILALPKLEGLLESILAALQARAERLRPEAEAGDISEDEMEPAAAVAGEQPEAIEAQAV